MFRNRKPLSTVYLLFDFEWAAAFLHIKPYGFDSSTETTTV